MARSLNKKYFGARNIGSASTATDDGIGGSAIGNIAFGAANNSSGFTAGATQISIATPTLPKGVRATASLVVGPAGALLTIAAGTSGTNVTTLTGSGIAVAVTQTYTGLTQKSTNGSGTGAVFTVVRTGGTSYGANTVVTCTSKGTGYVSGNTIVIDGASLGGVATTNDLTITLGGSVAAAGTITGITITEGGSGYTTVPAVTLSTGTQGTLTVTAALAADTGAVGSATYEENAILMTAYLTGGSALPVDIIRQVSTRRYKVTDGTLTGVVELTSTLADAAGECSIAATDSAGGQYFVTKLTGRKATLTRAGGSGWLYATGEAAPWSFDAPATIYVQIANA
jgi:hypothetical protein